MDTLQALGNKFFTVHYLNNDTIGVTLSVRSVEASNGQMIKAHILQLLEVHSLRNVIIDLAAVKSIDSFGLASLISVFKFCTKHNGNLALVQPTSVVLQLFEITRISKMLHIFDTVQEGYDFFSIDLNDVD
ncbi:MAG: STAS domain-containing protein [Vampirovibrio sp.]|jgi:anti-sigma B factor antagonist